MLKKVILGICCLCLCSCVSSRHTEQSVLEHQRQVDRAEESVRVRDRAIEDCLRELDHIATKSEGMGGDIEDIITQQFNDCYEQLVIEQTKNRQLKKVLISLISVLSIMISGVALVLYLELTHKTNFI